MYSEVLQRINEHGVDPSLATASVLRYVEERRYGEFLIESVGDESLLKSRGDSPMRYCPRKGAAFAARTRSTS